ncbi:MAG: DUF1697 domain-containing protein [Nocardioidaceae bacterium]|nr:DUF1697 domain-containing protein [Nocardioidaceae bacterium]
MPRYVAFLRAVNVGKRKYPMAELRAALEAAGYDGVETHIQTGNVVLTSTLRSRAKLETELERLFEKDRGFEVRTVVLTPAELAQVAADADTLAAEHPDLKGHYVSLLKDTPSAEGTRRLEGHGYDDETVVVRPRAVHLLYDKPYHEAKVSNVQVEKALGVATNRNAKVVRALAAKWG